MSTENAATAARSATDGYVVMPDRLTAENGAKALLIGEFTETIMLANPDHCGCGEEGCDCCRDSLDEPEELPQEVAVSWTTIKAIYAKCVEHLAT